MRPCIESSCVFKDSAPLLREKNSLVELGIARRGPGREAGLVTERRRRDFHEVGDAFGRGIGGWRKGREEEEEERGCEAPEVRRHRGRRENATSR